MEVSQRAYCHAVQNNAIRTNHIKARIDKTQQNSRCRLCGDRDGTINYIIRECSKLAQKEYKTRHDWADQVIHRELCKSLCLTIRTNGICTTQNLSWRFWDTNGSSNLGKTTKPRNNDKKKDNLPNSWLCCSSGPQSIIERKRKER